MITIKNILVATDFSDSARAALANGQALAHAFNASLHVLHVVTDPLHEPWSGFVPADSLMETVERRQTEVRHRLEKMVSEGRAVAATAWGDAADEILKYANAHRVDLIVCGTHGRRGWDHLVTGSVAQRVVRLAACPVLTVHAQQAVAVAA
jgi:nucleotide-binding universal stress UspA family protein